MKEKNIKRITILMILILNLMILSVNSVYASENSVEVPLYVKQNFEIHNTKVDSLNQIGTYELTSMSENIPMPNDKNGTYIFSVNGLNKKIIIPINYSNSGIYKYNLKQTTKDDENYIYDRTNYIITVYIKNIENGQLVPEVIVEKGDGKKCSEINFTNYYKGKEVSNSSEDNSINTGDEMNLAFWIIIGTSSIFMLVLILNKKKKINL